MRSHAEARHGGEIQRRRGRRLILPPLLAAFALLLLRANVVAAPLASVHDFSPLEQGVKAAFVYNFAKFVEWPPVLDAPAPPALIIGVLGEEEVAGYLAAGFAGKTVGDRPVVVKRLPGLEEARTCHVVFLGATQADRLNELVAQVAGLPVLLVGESEGFAARGGAIGFFHQAGKLRFEINPAAAARAHLKMSSRLMALAAIIHEESR